MYSARKKRSGAQKSGFTLIELLVVIAIISLLSSIVLASLNSARSKARDARRLSDIKTIQTALEMYYDKYGSYIEQGLANPEGGAIANILKPLVDNGFLSMVPTDPSPLVPFSYYGEAGYLYGSPIWSTIPPYAIDGESACAPGANTYALEFCLENPNSQAGYSFPTSPTSYGRYCYARCVR